MAKDQSNNQLFLLAIVAIIAIVGIVLMVTYSAKSSAVSTGDNDIVGEAYLKKSLMKNVKAESPVMKTELVSESNP